MSESYQSFLFFKKGDTAQEIETHKYTAKVIPAKKEDCLVPIDGKKHVSVFVCCLHLPRKFNQIMPQQQININPSCVYVTILMILSSIVYSSGPQILDTNGSY